MSQRGLASSRFRCVCGSMNQFNPAQGWIVQCGVCKRIVQLTPPKLLVKCPGCSLKMTMDPNITTAKCPKCTMIFTTQKPPSHQPAPVTGKQFAETPQAPAMGTVIAGGASSPSSANHPQPITAGGGGGVPEKGSAPLPEKGSAPLPETTGTNSGAVQAPSHFNTSTPMPMPQAAQEEEDVWSVANEQFELTFSGTKTAPKK